MNKTIFDVHLKVEPFLEGSCGRYAHPAWLQINVGTETITTHYHPETGSLETALPVDLKEITRWWAHTRMARFAVDYFPPMPVQKDFWNPFRNNRSVNEALSSFENLRGLLGSDYVDGDFEVELNRWVRHRVLSFADPRITLPPVAFYALGGEAFVEWVRFLEDQESPFVCDGGRWCVDSAQVDAEFEKIKSLGA